MILKHGCSAREEKKQKILALETIEPVFKSEKKSKKKQKSLNWRGSKMEKSKLLVGSNLQPLNILRIEKQCKPVHHTTNPFGLTRD